MCREDEFAPLQQRRIHPEDRLISSGFYSNILIEFRLNTYYQAALIWHKINKAGRQIGENDRDIVAIKQIAAINEFKLYNPLNYRSTVLLQKARQLKVLKNSIMSPGGICFPFKTKL